MGKNGPEPAYIVAIHPLDTLKVDVTFSTRGRQVRVRLKRRAGNRFLEDNAVGATGLLTWKGRKMVKWQQQKGTLKRSRQRARRLLPTPHPRATKEHTSFISYPGAAVADAYWIADVLEAAGITVWLDEYDLDAGDLLPDRIGEAIRGADSFIPLVDQAYLESAWCARELAIASAAHVRVAPVKFSFNKVTVPPELREVYESQLGDPLMLDLRRANAEQKLAAFASTLMASGGSSGER